MNEIAAPVVAGMALADEGTRAKIKEAVLAVVNGKSRATSGKLPIAATAIVITGER